MAPIADTEEPYQARWYRRIFSTLLDALLPPHPDEALLAQHTESSIMKKAKTATPIAVPDTYAVLSYDDPLVHGLIHGLKFRKQKQYAQMMGRIIARALVKHTSLPKTVIVVAVPASKQGARERGYDQGECIAEAASTDLGETAVYLPHALLRASHLGAQTAYATRKARHKRMHGAFMASPSVKNRLFGATVIAVDDVRTTGATLLEASRALIHAGAKRVICAAFAQTPEKSEARI